MADWKAVVHVAAIVKLQPSRDPCLAMMARARYMKGAEAPIRADRVDVAGVMARVARGRHAREQPMLSACSLRDEVGSALETAEDGCDRDSPAPRGRHCHHTLPSASARRGYAAGARATLPPLCGMCHVMVGAVCGVEMMILLQHSDGGDDDADARPLLEWEAAKKSQPLLSSRITDTSLILL